MRNTVPGSMSRRHLVGLGTAAAGLLAPGAARAIVRSGRWGPADPDLQGGLDALVADHRMPRQLRHLKVSDERPPQPLRHAPDAPEHAGAGGPGRGFARGAVVP